MDTQREELQGGAQHGASTIVEVSDRSFGGLNFSSGGGLPCSPTRSSSARVFSFPFPTKRNRTVSSFTCEQIDETSEEGGAEIEVRRCDENEDGDDDGEDSDGEGEHVDRSDDTLQIRALNTTLDVSPFSVFFGGAVSIFFAEGWG